MKVHIDAWDPSYGLSFDAGEPGGPAAAPQAQTTAPVDAAVERPPGAWQPLVPGAGVRAPDVVLLVDGVRRIDARVWVEGGDGVTRAGMCASYAAGVVRCDLAGGAAELVTWRVARGLFAPGGEPAPLAAHAGAVYQPHRVTGEEPKHLDQKLADQLTALELAVSADARKSTSDTEAAVPDLLVVDGPLRGRTGLPRTLGYAKTHHKRYLEPAQAQVVAALAAGQRTPVFALGAPWNRYSWYLRLPGPEGAPWAGVVRLEYAADRPAAEAIRFADMSAVTLPRLASVPYKDPRAPQNLVPIAGLERRLRALLGDPRLLLRGLRVAAARTARATAGTP